MNTHNGDVQFTLVCILANVCTQMIPCKCTVNFWSSGTASIQPMVTSLMHRVPHYWSWGEDQRFTHSSALVSTCQRSLFLTTLRPTAGRSGCGRRTMQSVRVLVAVQLNADTIDQCKQQPQIDSLSLQLARSLSLSLYIYACVAVVFSKSGGFCTIKSECISFVDHVIAC